MAATPTKIIFLITGLDVGGAETQLARLVTRLDRARFSPMVVSMIPPGKIAEVISSSGVDVRTLGMQRGRPSISGMLRFVRILRQERPAILVTFMYHANILGRIAGRVARVPVVISSIRNIHFGGAQRQQLMRATDCLCNNVVLNSATAAEAMIAKSVVKRGKVRVIPNGIDCSSYERVPTTRESMRSYLQASSNTFVWLSIGRFEEQKNHAMLLNAFAKFAASGRDTLLVLAGDGPLREQLVEQASRLRISEIVLFLGVRDDVPALLAAADGHVLSSSWEGLPNALIEASAAGVPSIATNVGGVSEILEHGKSGFIVPAGDESALAKEMIRLSSIPEEERNRIALHARDHVQANYAIDRVVAQWVELFMSNASTPKP